MKRILVPSDFSADSYKAFDYAVAIAQKNGAEIDLLHTVEHSIIHPLKANAMAEHSHQLQQLKTRTETTASIKVNTFLHQEDLVKSILNHQRNQSPDLVVMGTHGHSRVRNRFFGSKTSTVLSQSTVPVIAVPVGNTWLEPKKMLLAVNNSEEDFEVLRVLFELSSIFASEIHIAIFTAADEDVDEVMAATQHMQAIRSRISSIFQKDITKLVHLSGHHFHQSVQEYIDEHQINLISMITHKRDFLQQLFQLSMTRQMSYHTSIPLLSINAQ